MMRVVSVASSIFRLLTISMSNSSSLPGVGDGLLDLSAVGDLRHLVHGGELRVGLFAIRLQRGGLEQELHARLRQLVGLRGDGLLGLLDLREINVANFLERDQFAAEMAQRGEVVNEVLQLVEAGAAQRLESFLATLAHVLHATCWTASRWRRRTLSNSSTALSAASRTARSAAST